jgi:hypothetical protein
LFYDSRNLLDNEGRFSRLSPEFLAQTCNRQHLYAKDNHVSLFHKDVVHLNVDNLDTLYTRFGGFENKEEAGLASSYAYFATSDSYFGCHKEASNLHAKNMEVSRHEGVYLFILQFKYMNFR